MRQREGVAQLLEINPLPVIDPLPELLNPTRLLFDLQRGSAIAQRLSGCLDPEVLAHRVTEGLVETFDCAFARIWLVEPDRTALRLVASSGMYTHTNGFFRRVPMGAYKVGKIAQNRIPFLSNNLADEPWVKDRDWAIAYQIKGFAGYPLMIDQRVIGVLAAFSHHPMAPEFIEVLQNLCTTVAVALDMAITYEQEQQTWQRSPLANSDIPQLSDQIATILTPTRVTLVGTEQPLNPSWNCIFLRMAEILHAMECVYCRLTYSQTAIALEAIVTTPGSLAEDNHHWARSHLNDVQFMVSCLGGSLQSQAGANQKSIQVSLQLPYPNCKQGVKVRVQCQQPLLQIALTHLACLAGLTVCNEMVTDAVLLTDDPTLAASTPYAVWLRSGLPDSAAAVPVSLNLSANVDDLVQAVRATLAGQPWQNDACASEPPLSEREIEVLSLLGQGLRDRDIAQQLMISESTVKFHLNNASTKLGARTRYQTLYEAIVRGWIR